MFEQILLMTGKIYQNNVSGDMNLQDKKNRDSENYQKHGFFKKCFSL